jgi:hypothetical protein
VQSLHKDIARAEPVVALEILGHGRRNQSGAEKPHVSNTETWGTHPDSPLAVVICSRWVLRVNKNELGENVGHPAQIIVNGKPLNFDRSVYCDLADLNSGSVTIQKGVATVTLYGGDASGSYVLRLEVDSLHACSIGCSPAVLPQTSHLRREFITR